MEVRERDELDGAMAEAFAHEGPTGVPRYLRRPNGTRVSDARGTERLHERHVAEQEREELTCAGLFRF
jgi:hypothetical protein